MTFARAFLLTSLAMAVVYAFGAVVWFAMWLLEQNEILGGAFITFCVILFFSNMVYWIANEKEE